MSEILTTENIRTIIEILIIPILAYVAKYLVDYIKVKKEATKNSDKSNFEKSVLGKVYDTIIDCIECTNQTYADALRASGAFDENAQREALVKTTNAVLTLLTDETKESLSEIVGDIGKYLNVLIESTIKQNKLAGN
ncbi:hypothetical protein IMSAG049_00769 [Clostridiales bacterium]|nr:hypothetical protein IMSAG049_00769 [Clostridiales bacterium]